MSNQEQAGDVITGVIRGNTGQAAIGKNNTQTQGTPHAVDPQEREHVIAQLCRAIERGSVWRAYRHHRHGLGRIPGAAPVMRRPSTRRQAERTRPWRRTA